MSAGCIPCSVETGCALTVDFDHCQPMGDRTTLFAVSVVGDDGVAFEFACSQGNNSPACTGALEDWVKMHAEGPVSLACGDP